MTRHLIGPAGAADDAALRRLAAETPMPGRIRLAFPREPSFFGALAVEGDWHEVLAARDASSGECVGFGTRSVRTAYVNGRPARVGFLGALRVRADRRGGLLLARGYRAFLARHRADRRCALYLTTIMEDNAPARALLGAGRAGLPAYRDAGRYLCAAVRPARPPRRRGRPSVAVGPATRRDLGRLASFLAAEGARRQFFPVYGPADLAGETGLLRGLRPEDILLARAGGNWPAAWRHGTSPASARCASRATRPRSPSCGPSGTPRRGRRAARGCRGPARPCAVHASPWPPRARTTPA